MTAFGYTMMCEQSGPAQLVRDIRQAEEAGFDFSVISDHYQPWLASQGHSGYAWAILGAAAHATERIGLMSYVTCPTLRYHPAIVAQKAATVAVMSGGRFRLGVGAGENLNEHVVGRGWPPVRVRHEMLEEAIAIMRALWEGRYYFFEGSTTACTTHGSSRCRRSRRRSTWPSAATRPSRSRCGRATGWSRLSRAPS